MALSTTTDKIVPLKTCNHINTHNSTIREAGQYHLLGGVTECVCRPYSNLSSRVFPQHQERPFFPLLDSQPSPPDYCRNCLLGGSGHLASFPSVEALPLLFPLPSTWSPQGQLTASCAPGGIADCVPSSSTPFKIVCP